jgi:hypothetical protein
MVTEALASLLDQHPEVPPDRTGGSRYSERHEVTSKNSYGIQMQKGGVGT